MSESRIVLYGPRAPLTEKVGQGLRLKGLGFELVEPASPEDYARLSPETGLLPLLEFEGIRVPDSCAILDFLDARVPEPRLVSADPRVVREQGRTRTEASLDDLAQLLGERPFFYADQISRADLSVCAALAVMYREVYEGARQLLAARPRLLAYVERVLDATGRAEPIGSRGIAPFL